MYTVRDEYFYYCLASKIWNKANNNIVASLMSEISINMLLNGEYYG